MLAISGCRRHIRPLGGPTMMPSHTHTQGRVVPHPCDSDGHPPGITDTIVTDSLLVTGTGGLPVSGNDSLLLFLPLAHLRNSKATLRDPVPDRLCTVATRSSCTAAWFVPNTRAREADCTHRHEGTTKFEGRRGASGVDTDETGSGGGS